MSLMRRALKTTLWKASPWLNGSEQSAPPKPERDPRAERYFATAARYNAAASALGYESLEQALSDGRMSEILRRATNGP
jgi:hypothetical protein